MSVNTNYYQLDENRKQFTFRTESAWYYSFYTDVLNKTMDDSIGMFMNYSMIEKTPLNAFSRFTIVPEFVVGHLYNIFGHGSPIDFYITVVFLLNAVGIGIFLNTLTTVSGQIAAGSIMVSSFSFISRLWYYPSLRESWGLPWFWIHIYFTVRHIRGRDSVYTCMSSTFASVLLLLSWQFAPFMIYAEQVSLICCVLYGVISISQFGKLSALLSISLLCTNEMSWLYSITMLITASCLYSSSIWSLVIAALTVAIQQSPNDDFSHVKEYLSHRILGTRSNFHVKLYMDMDAFNYQTYDNLKAMVMNGLIPLFTLSCIMALYNKTPAHVFMSFISVIFGGLSMFIMRFQAISIPLMCLTVGMLSSHRFKYLWCIFILCFFRTSTIQWKERSELFHVDRIDLNEWLSSQPKHRILSDMVTSSDIRLHTDHHTFVHPHFENSRLRKDVFIANSLYSNSTPFEVYEQFTQHFTNLTLVVMDMGRCKHGNMCWNIIFDSSPFYIQYISKQYVVMGLEPPNIPNVCGNVTLQYNMYGNKDISRTSECWCVLSEVYPSALVHIGNNKSRWSQVKYADCVHKAALYHDENNLCVDTTRELYQLAMQLAPESSSVNSNYAYFEFLQSKYKKANDIVKGSLLRWPESSWVHCVAALLGLDVDFHVSESLRLDKNSPCG